MEQLTCAANWMQRLMVMEVMQELTGRSFLLALRCSNTSRRTLPTSTSTALSGTATPPHCCNPLHRHCTLHCHYNVTATTLLLHCRCCCHFWDYCFRIILVVDYMSQPPDMVSLQQSSRHHRCHNRFMLHRAPPASLSRVFQVEHWRARHFIERCTTKWLERQIRQTRCTGRWHE